MSVYRAPGLKIHTGTIHCLGLRHRMKNIHSVGKAVERNWPGKFDVIRKTASDQTLHPLGSPPHPAIVIVRHKRDYILVLLYWGGVLLMHPSLRAPQILLLHSRSKPLKHANLDEVVVSEN